MWRCADDYPAAGTEEINPMTTPIRVRTRVPATRSSATQSDTGKPNDPHRGLELAIRYEPPALLKPPKRPLRKPSGRSAAALRTSIASFGFLNPILVDDDGRIVCGHARWLAAQELGLEQVPVICVTHLSEEQLRLYAIAEGRIGELSEWDVDALRIEFAELAGLDLGLDINLELTGFSTSEIDDLLVKKGAADPADPTRLSHAPVTQAGDLWQLGAHKLLCGDALDEYSYLTLMGRERAQMVFCDPPYNQPMRNISGQDWAEFAMASGEMSREEFTTFLATSFQLMARFSADGAIHFQCMDWHHQREMLEAGEAAYARLRNLIVWDKGKGGMGSFYRSQHELIYAWQVGDGTPINNFGLGDTGRYRTNVWAYQGNNTFHSARNEELAAHPTVKPAALVADALRDCSHRNSIVLDGFGGSGSTLLAAQHTGRMARLIEIDPGYCDCTIERWQALTGGEAVCAATGQTWSERAQERGIDPAADRGPDLVEAD